MWNGLGVYVGTVGGSTVGAGTGVCVGTVGATVGVGRLMPVGLAVSTAPSAGLGVYVGKVGGSTVGPQRDALLATVGGTFMGDPCPKPNRSQFTLATSTSPARI